MAYRKRYEDSYLDDEEEPEGTPAGDITRLQRLSVKEDITAAEEQMVGEIVQRIATRARMVGAIGADALSALEYVITLYEARGALDEARKLWVILLECAEATGNKELYYRAADQLA